MIASILSDLVSDIFRRVVRAVIALTFVAICLLGVGFATGMVHPSDLRPEHVRKTIVSIQDRLNFTKGFEATDNIYGADAGQSEVSGKDNATLAGNY